MENKRLGENDMTRDKWQEKQHNKNLKAFIEFGRRVANGELRIMDIRIDTEQFGNSRVIIFVQEKEEKEEKEEGNNGRSI